MSKCASCDAELPADNDFVKCLNGCMLHYTCAGISERSWRTFTKTKRENYRCVLCRGANCDSNSTKGGDSNPATPTDSVNPFLSTKFFDDLEKRIERVVNAVIDSKWQEMAEKMNSLESSVDFCSGKIDDFVKTMSEYSKRMDSIEKMNSELVAKNTELEKELSSFKVQFEEMQQYGRNHNVQIDGVPEVQNENVLDIVNKLAITLDETIVLNTDIQAVQRLPTRDDRKPRPIVVQFTNRQKRDSVMKKARSVRPKSDHFVAGVPSTNVYVNEHLTPYYKKRFYEARLVKQAKSYKYLWISNSKIFMRKDENANPVRISRLEDLRRL